MSAVRTSKGADVHCLPLAMRRSGIWSTSHSSSPSAAPARPNSTKTGTVSPNAPNATTEGGGQFVDWPLYKCRCHFLQVSRKDDRAMVEIHETTTRSSRVHQIGEFFTDPAKRIPGRIVWSHPWGHAFASSIRAGKLPPRGTAKGFSQRLGAGHRLSIVFFWQIPAFNWFERARTGHETCGLRLTGPYGEDCTFMPDGSITPSQHCPIPCMGSFDPWLGHMNRDINPFQYARGMRPPGGWSWHRVD